jgi:hypothetical protein
MDSMMQIHQFAIAINKALYQVQTYKEIRGPETMKYISQKFLNNKDLCTMNKTVDTRKHNVFIHISIPYNKCSKIKKFCSLN